MPKCSYNCLDSAGVGTDMRKCELGCVCMLGDCDMRSCNYRNNVSANANAKDYDNDQVNGNNNNNENNNNNGCFCGGVDHDSCGAKNWSTEMIIGSVLAFVFLGIGIGIVYIYWKKKRITTAASSSSIEYAMDRPHAFA